MTASGAKASGAVTGAIGHPPYYKPSKGAKGKDGKGKGKGKVGKDFAQWKEWGKGDSADAREQEKESLKSKLRAMQEEYNTAKKKADGAYYAEDQRQQATTSTSRPYTETTDDGYWSMWDRAYSVNGLKSL